MRRLFPLSPEAVAIGLLLGSAAKLIFEGAQQAIAGGLISSINWVLWEKGLQFGPLGADVLPLNIIVTDVLAGMVLVGLGLAALLMPEKQKTSAEAEAPKP